MNWRRIAFWFGVIALLDAVLLVAPLGLPDELLTRVVPQAIVPLLALVAAGYGIKVLATAAGDTPRRHQPVTLEPTTDDVERVGQDIDEAFDSLESTAATTWSSVNAQRMLRSELRRSAVTALEARGHSREEAERLLDSGAWTDDRRAASFLGEEHLPLAMRVRDWASGEADRRRAEAAVEELARLTETGSGGRGLVPERADRRPAGELFGDALDAGGPATTERTTELEPEVDA